LELVYLKIAICDDEQEYIEDVEKHLKQYFSENGLSLELFKFSSSSDILNSCKNFDIALLDVEMDGVNGIEIGKELKKENADTVLIYVTAYNHYLDDALDLGIIRFFDKPINSSRFYAGLEKAISKVDKTEIKFYLKDKNRGIVTVFCKDIIYIEIIGRKTKVVTKDREYISKNNIKFWKEKLNKSYFECPHNSFIINTNYITYYHKAYIILDEKYNIPIAYSKRAEFKRQLMMLMEG